MFQEKKTTEERFWSKVDKTDSCWNWTAYKAKDGYGKFSFEGKRKLAHRYSYELKYGKIPQGLTIDHLCRNRACVNPDHLEDVTQKENILRGLSGSPRKTHCPQGHPYSGNNLYTTPNGDNQCRTCRRIHHRNYNQRKYRY